MGYTHYWEHEDIDAGVFATLADDARKLADASGVPLAGWDGTGEPVFAPEEIRLNGYGDDAHETFALTPEDSGDFCKTGRAPYDVVVAAILLRASATVPGFIVKSDGDWSEDEWVNARDLYARTFGETPDKPARMRD